MLLFVLVNWYIGHTSIFSNIREFFLSGSMGVVSDADNQAKLPE